MNLLVLVAVAPMFGVIVLGRWWLVPATGFAIAWTAFVAWRVWTIARTGLIGADAGDIDRLNNG